MQPVLVAHEWKFKDGSKPLETCGVFVSLEEATARCTQWLYKRYDVDSIRVKEVIK